MANPKNPLDDFSIYTYHIAIFMHKTHKKLLSEMDSFDWQETKTTRDSANGACLLNSVTDPFQLIQELKIQQIAPSVSAEFKTSPFGTFAFRISEPGNCMFITKIAKLMKQYDTKAYASAVWGIKIKFVGRFPDSEIDEILDIPSITGILSDIKGSFNHMGSTYDLSFVMADTSGVGQLQEHSNSIYISTMVEPVTISEVETLGDAVSKLQETLQNNYNEEITRSLGETQLRKIRYDFSIKDGEIAGFKVDGTLQDHINDKKYYFSFPKNTPIAHAFTTIIHRCPELMKLVGESKDDWRKPFHLNGKMYQILSSTEHSDEDIVVKFEIGMYYGSESEIEPGETKTTNSTNHTLYEFDFYYTDNYNTDIINFDMSANVGLILYLGGTPRLTDDAMNRLSKIEHDAAVESGGKGGYVINKNDKVDGEQPFKQKNIKVTGGSGDIAIVGVQDNAFGGASSLYNKDRTAALESLAKYCSIDSVSKTLSIRGHAKLLQQCFANGCSLGTSESMWVKLNIFSRDDENNGSDSRVKYFYDGVYSIMGAEHIFMDGKFTQELTLLMMDYEWLNDIDTGDENKTPEPKKSDDIKEPGSNE